MLVCVQREVTPTIFFIARLCPRYLAPAMLVVSNNYVFLFYQCINAISLQGLKCFTVSLLSVVRCSKPARWKVRPMTSGEISVVCSHLIWKLKLRRLFQNNPAFNCHITTQAEQFPTTLVQVTGASTVNGNRTASQNGIMWVDHNALQCAAI